jgi:hypothetical protein
MDVPIRVGDRMKWKPGGVMCPHLVFQEGTTIATCAVHSEPWYKDTPCFVYGNPDIDPDFELKRGRPCPVGKIIQEGGGLIKLRPGLKKATIEELEDVGPWEDPE